MTFGTRDKNHRIKLHRTEMSELLTPEATIAQVTSLLGLKQIYSNTMFFFILIVS